MSEEVVREWLERKEILVRLETNQEQKVQKLEGENRLLRERVRGLEKMNNLLVRKVKKQEGVRIKAQIELGAKRVYS